MVTPGAIAGAKTVQVAREVAAVRDHTEQTGRLLFQVREEPDYIIVYLV
jgi:hypothetical protein